MFVLVLLTFLVFVACVHAADRTTPEFHAFIEGKVDFSHQQLACYYGLLNTTEDWLVQFVVSQHITLLEMVAFEDLCAGIESALLRLLELQRMPDPKAPMGTALYTLTGKLKPRFPRFGACPLRMPRHLYQSLQSIVAFRNSAVHCRVFGAVGQQYGEAAQAFYQLRLLLVSLFLFAIVALS